MYKIRYKIRNGNDTVYTLTCDSIEQALQLAKDMLLCQYEIIWIRQV